MNILFLGGLFRKSKEKEIFEKSKAFVYAAASAHQWNIINGIKDKPDVNCFLLNTVYVGTYPKEYADVYINKEKWNEDGIKAEEVGFINFFGLRTVARAVGVYNSMCRWCKKNKGNDNVAIVYSMITSSLIPAMLVKRRYKDLKLCLYVPDLPNFFTDNVSKGKIYRFLKGLDCKLMNKALKSIDGFVLLTESMNERINPEKKPFLIAEGIVSNDEAVKIKGSEIKEKNIVYTGKTDVEFGILELVNVFEYIKDKSIFLDIYGGGNADDIIIQESKKNPAIRFHGSVMRDVALQKQREALVLVNPRNPQREFTEYSFPSKTLEYMLAGRPVIMHSLAGIPEEYSDYLIYFDSDKPEKMAETIEWVVNLGGEQLAVIGEKAREFVTQGKNTKVQGDKLCNFLKLLHSSST